MKCVRIVQCLCPERHCIVATAYESETGDAIPEILEGLKDGVAALIAGRGMNPWCGLCHSREWRYEDQATRFQTMEEATPYLREQAKNQLVTAQYFREVRN